MFRTLYIALCNILWTSTLISTTRLPCSLKDVAGDSFVCVCNATYCDMVDPITEPSSGTYHLYRSTKNGDRLNLSHRNLTPSPATKLVLTVNSNVTYQEILGFGGAFTDAAGINILSLSQAVQTNLLQSYFSSQGIGYTVGRIPMASCDFSTHAYSYDDTPGDLDLSKFSLAPEDLKYKIPVIKAAMKMNTAGNMTLFGSPWSAPAWMKTNDNMTGNGTLIGQPGGKYYKTWAMYFVSDKAAMKMNTAGNMTLFGSPWSAPAWMKTNDNMTGNGTLIGQPGGKYYKTWAMYFVRFLQEYEKHGISIWGLTGQNEPTDGNVPKFRFQAMGWTPESQRDFIALDLGPTLEKYGYGKVKIMILDDSRLQLPYWPEQVFKNADAMKYVSGIAVHWYQDFIAPAIALSSTHKMFPDKFILATEACEGSFFWDIEKVKLGSWMRAESYAHDILQDLKNWVVGWTDWNIALDMEGGPNWVKNFVDSPIIVNSAKDEFYKQPMFYALAHFSKFVVPGSKRIDIQGPDLSKQLVDYVAFIRPDSLVAFILLNRSEVDGEVSVRSPGLGYINLYFPARSIQTVLYKTS